MKQTYEFCLLPQKTNALPPSPCLSPPQLLLEEPGAQRSAALNSKEGPWLGTPEQNSDGKQRPEETTCSSFLTHYEMELECSICHLQIKKKNPFTIEKLKSPSILQEKSFKKSSVFKFIREILLKFKN